MSIKNFLLVWLLSYVAIFACNGIFHLGLAASFFDDHLHAIGGIRMMKDANPAPLFILDLIIVFGMTYMICMSRVKDINYRKAATIGALLNLISSSAWNLANAAMFDWPVIVTVSDIAWHTALGALGGMLIFWLGRRFRVIASA
jgi:uncharacterized membrane protein